MKLFNDTEIFQKERPLVLSSSQHIELYTKLVQEVIDNNWCDAEVNDIMDDLEGLFQDDGHNIRNELNRSRKHYSTELDFLEFLENIHYEKDNYQIQNIKDWVNAHNIRPDFNKGQALKSLTSSRAFVKDNTYYITGVKKETAEYCIDEDKDRKGGYILTFEKVESNFIKT